MYLNGCIRMHCTASFTAKSCPVPWSSAWNTLPKDPRPRLDPRIEFGKGSKSWAEFMGVECARWRLTWFEGRSLSIMDNYGAFQPTPSKRSIRSKLAAQIFSTNLSSSSHSLGNSTCVSLYQVCEISNPPFQLRDALAQIEVMQRVQFTCTGLSICKTLPVLVRVSEDDVIISVTNSS